MEVQSQIKDRHESFFGNQVMLEYHNNKIWSITKKKEEFIYRKLDEHLSRFHKWLVFSFNLNWLVMKFVSWKNDISILEDTSDITRIGIRIKGKEYWETIKICSAGEGDGSMFPSAG